MTLIVYRQTPWLKDGGSLQADGFAFVWGPIRGDAFGDLWARNNNEFFMERQAMEDDTRFLCKTTDYYAKDYEAAIRWNDPELAI